MALGKAIAASPAAGGMARVKPLPPRRLKGERAFEALLTGRDRRGCNGLGRGHCGPTSCGQGLEGPCLGPLPRSALARDQKEKKEEEKIINVVD
ncbi:hypothetical protein NL676_016766 [Syzygium grande]|nr:hypothetical protein NL676_016766 [Syzygium grande]